MRAVPRRLPVGFLVAAGILLPWVPLLLSLREAAPESPLPPPAGDPPPPEARVPGRPPLPEAPSAGDHAPAEAKAAR